MAKTVYVDAEGQPREPTLNEQALDAASDAFWSGLMRRHSYGAAIADGTLSYSDTGAVCGMCGTKNCVAQHDPRDRRADLGSVAGQ